jgi:DNA-binding CsgD family transcriptional regulator
MFSSGHYCFQAEKDIQKIAAPLFKATGINFFSYARDFNHNQSISLQSDNQLFHAWHEANNAYCSSVIPEGVYTFENTMNQRLRESAEKLNYGNGIQIFKRHNAFNEIFAFAAPEDVDVLLFYANHRELINKFIFYFKDRSSKLIANALQAPFTVPDHMLAINNTKAVTKIDIDTLSKIFNTRHYFFDDREEIKLSKREVRCLNLYLKGLSTTQIANIMNVKKVTADTFMRNVKHKFNCSSKSALFEKLWEYKVLNTNGIFD